MATEPLFSDLRYFVQVAEIQNLTRAAKKLGLAQPSLSEAMWRLEEAVGSQLLLRGKSGVRLTKAGFALLAKSKELMEKWKDTQELVTKSDREVTGRYSLGCHATLAVYNLPVSLPALWNKYPGIHIELTHNVSRKITEDVVEFRLDFGIVADPVPHPDLVIRQLGTDIAGFWVKASGLGRRPFSPDDYVLVCDPGIAQTYYLLREAEKRKIYFNRYLHTQRLDLVVTLVNEGGSLGIFPSRAMGPIRTGKLRMLEELPTMENRVCLIYRQDALKSAAFREIVRFIEARCKWE